MPLATIVDSKALWESVVAAFVAGVGFTAIFCVVIYGTARFADLNRTGRSAAAVAYGILAVVALVAFVASVVIGIVVMMSK